MQSPDFNASTILSAVRRQLEAPALVSPQALPFSAQKKPYLGNFTISQFLQLGKEAKLAGYIATIMKAMDTQITFKQFPSLAEKKAKLGDMIECALRNSESLSESLLAKLMRTEEMRAILGVLGVTGVNGKTTAAVMHELLAAAITRQLPLGAPLIPEHEQIQQPEEHALTLIQQTQQIQQPEQIQLANLQDQNAALLVQVQQMQIRMLEQTHLHEKEQLDAQQKVHDLELLQRQQHLLHENTVLDFEQQQQLEPNANKRKRPTTSTKKPGGPSRKSKKKKSEFGRATTPISRWAGSTFYKGEKKYDPPIPQKDVDMSETLEAVLIGWRSCAAGKLHRLQRETIGNNMLLDAVNWFDPSGHSTHVRIDGKRHKRRATAAFSISWYEGEMGKDAHGDEEWQEVLHTDDDVQLTADMLFNFNGKGGEPNNAGVHCAYIAAIKNAGVKTTLFDQAGQISYAPTDEELRATVDYNPNYKRILAKRAKADLGSPCLEID